VAYGNNALLSNTTGNENIAIGLDAGQNLTNGSNNIDIGDYSPSSNTTNLTASLKEEASLLRKVSAQIQVSKPAPQVAANNN
jgi:hypothetical protein